MITAKD